jgi:hypothetical protein
MRIQEEMERIRINDRGGEHMIVGDFNLHHPSWGGAGTRGDAEAEDLLEIMDAHDMEIVTEPGVVTWERKDQQSTIDLTIISNGLLERLVNCVRGDDIDHDSDHWPIRTVLDITVPQKALEKRRNWKEMDEKLFLERLELIDTIDLSRATKRRIELQTMALMAAIRRAVDTSTPWARPSQYANPDFTGECRDAIKLTRRLRRQFTRTHQPGIWVQYCIARNQKKRLIEKQLRHGHRQRVQQVTEEGPHGLWRLANWARKRTGAYDQGITPTLHVDGQDAESIQDKARLFQQAFFPDLPTADLSDMKDYNYPESIEIPPITMHELEQVSHGLPADKAPGDDGTPNRLWQTAIKTPRFAETLLQIFNACIRTGYNPSHFQRSITVVLRKQGDDRDYRNPESYRPVALLNTLGKILESIVATRISYLMEKHKLLPATHLGGRRGISTDHAIQGIIDRIQRAWGKKKPVVSMVLMDVGGAYDNALHTRLLHNLRKRRLGTLVPWISAFLTGRSTKIRMAEGISESIPTTTGIPQGSPLSPILYLFYNADLIEGCSQDGVLASGWVDDVSLITEGTTEEENIRRLQKASQRADLWARRHASVFDHQKYKLIHFINPNTDTQPGYTALPLEGVTIPATTTAERYLGIWLDPKLTFTKHREKAIAKAGTSLQAIRGLAGSTWGASLIVMRRLYQAIIIPQMLHGIAAWYHPATAKQRDAIIREFAKIQHRAACLISGAFRTTAVEALNVELHLPPMRLQMERICKETAIRIRTGPRFARPIGISERRPAAQRRRGGWTPMEVQAWKKGGSLMTPPETVAGRWESRKAYLRAPWQAPPKVTIQEREEATKSHNMMTKKISGST